MIFLSPRNFFSLTDATVPRNQIRSSYKTLNHQYHDDDEAVVPRPSSSSSCWQNSIFDTDSDENENYGFVPTITAAPTKSSMGREEETGIERKQVTDR